MNTAEDELSTIAETNRLIIREIGMEELAEYQNIINTCAAGIAPDLVGLEAEEFADRHRAYIRFQYGFYGYGIWGIWLKKSISDSGATECGTAAVNSGTAECGIAAAQPMIGLVGLVNGSASRVGELFYAILPEYRRQGYAYEACTAALEYGRECGFKDFEVRIEKDNLSSLSLAEKLGALAIKEV